MAWRSRGAIGLMLACELAVACKGKAGDGVQQTSTSPAPPHTDDARPTIFVKKGVTVGQKREDSSDMTMSTLLNIDAHGEGKSVRSEMALDESMRAMVEVVAANADVVQKIKVSFSSFETTVKENGKEKKRSNPVAGKTYVVESKNGLLEIHDERGKTVSTAERTTVERQYRTIGKADPFVSALPTSPVKPGQKIESLGKALVDQMKDNAEGMSISDVAVTFKDVAGDDGIFDITAKMSRDDGPMTMTIDLRGETRVSVKTGEPIKIELKGPIVVTSRGDKSKAKIDGSGVIAMKMERKPL